MCNWVQLTLQNRNISIRLWTESWNIFQLIFCNQKCKRFLNKKVSKSNDCWDDSSKQRFFESKFWIASNYENYTEDERLAINIAVIDANSINKFIWKELCDRLKSLSFIFVDGLVLVSAMLPGPVITVETTYCWSILAGEVSLLTMNWMVSLESGLFAFSL